MDRQVLQNGLAGESIAAAAAGVTGGQDALHRLLAAGFGRSIDKWFGADAVGSEAASRFIEQIARVDWTWLVRLRQDVLAVRDGLRTAEPDLVPAPSVDYESLDSGLLRERGLADLRAGRWGVLIFAGGAATRFWSGAADHPQAAEVIRTYGGNPPKGLFPVGPVSGRSFLDLFAGEIVEAAARAGRPVPLILMASRSTEAALRTWVQSGLSDEFPRGMVRIIVQAEHPRLDMDGDLIVRPDGSLVFTGDGHGGVYRALLAKGEDGLTAVEWLRSLGVAGIVLHNVDNVAAGALEPVRLGFHSQGGFLLTMSAVPRDDPFEKVGIVARHRDSGRIEVVEYSVCPHEVAEAVDSGGALLFKPAHINTNLVSLDAVSPDLPPTLYAGKEVEVGGRLVQACSHEMLNQSLAGMLDPARVGTLILPRNRFFQPTKSLKGADSLETTRAWLAERGWF